MKKLFLQLLLTLIIFFSPLIPSLTYADQTNNESVSVTVPARPSDFHLAISASPSTTVNQNTTITYTITYGTDLSYATPITLTASWTQGTIQGQGSLSVDGLDYVLNSATNAYGNTPPVVNLTNKKITWTIASFPGNTTDQTITFQLKTNVSYTGTNLVTFPINAHMDVTGVTIPDQTVTTTYHYNTSVTSTPTPTNTPTPTVTPTPSPTPLPSSSSPTTTPTITPSLTPVPTPLLFTDISLRTVSTTTATINVTTNIPTKSLTTMYGISLNSLTKTFTTLTTSNSQIITLSDLEPGKTYYFRIIAKDTIGQSITSDYFSFTTAIKENTNPVNQNTVIVTSGNVVVYAGDHDLNHQLQNTAIVPENVLYAFQFALVHPETIKKIQARILNIHVLAAQTAKTSPLANAPENFITLIEVKPGIYSGQLETPLIPAIYEFLITVNDSFGNISEQKLFTLNVVSPMMIFSRKTKQPVENARVYLWVYNSLSKTYEGITPQTLPIENPSFSNPDGKLSFVLPQGQYKATITSAFYQEKTIDFVIDAESRNIYPQVYLEGGQFKFATLTQYYTDLCLDFFSTSKNYIRSIAISHRFFTLIATIIILCFVILSLLGLSQRLGISLIFLPWLLVHEIKNVIFRKKNHDTIGGYVIDEYTKTPISHAIIYLINADTNRIIYKSSSSLIGDFLFPSIKSDNVKIAIHKKGYNVHEFFEFSSESFAMDNVHLMIKRNEKKQSIFQDIYCAVDTLLGYIFEIVLTFTIILELLFGSALGWKFALPFIIISLLNLFLLLLHIRQLKR